MNVPPNDVMPADIHLLTRMMDTMADHVFILRVDGDRYQLVYCNDAMDRFMNPTDETLCGKYLDELVPDPALYQRIADNYAKALAAGQMVRYEESTEGFDLAPITVFETSLSPLTSACGRSIYICGISRNITARRNAERALQDANASLELQLAENRRLQEQLQQEAIRDPLTNLFNRRYFGESLDREFARAEREGYPITLMMIDIDHFKQLNDERGHAAGDHVLTEFSKLLCEGMRQEDVVCRWGGEEFLVMMPGLALDHARKRISQWQQEHSPMKFGIGDSLVTIRFSAGLATAPEHGQTPDELINATDEALYRAKTQGRDQLQVSEPSPLTTKTKQT